MPVIVRKKNGKFRIIEPGTGRVMKSRKGVPMDGGGHLSRTKARAQARAINRTIK